VNFDDFMKLGQGAYVARLTAGPRLGLVIWAPPC
jgi:hypothetical protein